MAVRDRLLALALIAAVAALGAGCSGTAAEPELGTRTTEAMAEIERTKQAAEESKGAALPESSTDAEAVARAAAEAAQQEPVDRTKPVHFETANPEGDRPPKPTLFEASEAARKQRQANTSPPSSMVITDANLGDYSKGGQITELVTEGFEDAAPGAQTVPVAGSPADDQETYWRARVRDARLAWRAAADRVTELENQVAKLRYDFYVQDDPAYRDMEIKPAWDRAAIELTQERLRVSDLETQLELILAAGYEADALPGWLREGLEFEPPTANEPGEGNQVGVAEPIEPPIMDDPPR